MPALLIGFVAGVLLAALRAPLGVELFQLPATAAETAYGYRAAALAAVALGIAAAAPALRPRVPVARLVLGAAIGFGYRGLDWERDPPGLATVFGAVAVVWLASELLAARRGRARGLPTALRAAAAAAGLAALTLVASEPERPGAALAFGAFGVAAMALCGRWRLLAPAAATPSEPPERPPVGLASGLAVAGAGVALAFEGFVRPLRLLEGALAPDDALTATLLLALAAIGAAAFAQSLASPGAARFGAGPWLAACALAAFLAASKLDALGGEAALKDYLKSASKHLHWGEVGLADHGTLAYDVVIAGPVLALPAVLLGAGLRALRRPAELAALLLGAAVGTVLVPSFLRAELGAAAEAADPGAGLVPTGAKLAALGALAALALAGGLRSWTGRAGLLAVVGSAVAAFLLPAPAATPAVAPWWPHPVVPTLVLRTPEGLLSVAPSGSGIDVVSLDHRPLTPPLEDARADRAEIVAAWEVLPEEVRARRDVHVLLIGQLSPGRALALTGLGATRIDRSASWYRAMPSLESELFRDHPLPDGDVLAPSAARERLAEGEYDLLLTLPVPGDGPTTRNLGWPLATRELEGEPEREPVAVIWLDSRSPVAHVELGERVLPATADLGELAVALVYGRDPSAPPAIGRSDSSLGAGAPLPRPDPIDRLLEGDEARRREDRTALARRLAGGNARGSDGALTEGLARLYAGQVRSSAYETHAQRMELPREALERFRDAAVAAEDPGRFLREVIAALADILRGKRWVEEIGTYFTPIAERHPGWPEVEKALAYAELELLDPAAAARRLGALAASGATDLELWLMLGEAQAQSGSAEAAVASFERALALRPGDRGLRRRLAIQLVLAGNPEGQERVQGLLLEEPEDEGLRAYTGPGPYPPLPSGYQAPATAGEP